MCPVLVEVRIGHQEPLELELGCCQLSCRCWSLTWVLCKSNMCYKKHPFSLIIYLFLR